MELLRGIQDAAASRSGRSPASAEQRPMDLVLRGFLDLRKVLQPVGNEVRSEAPSQKPGRGGRGGGRGYSAAGEKASSPPVAFHVAWKTYCSQNPRLRDPRALPALVRRGVPDDLRAEVWSHCLGIEASRGSASSCASGAASPGGASPSAASSSTTPADTSPKASAEDDDASAAASPQEEGDAFAEAQKENLGAVALKQAAPGEPQGDMREAPQEATDAAPAEAECLPEKRSSVDSIGTLEKRPSVDDIAPEAFPHGLAELIEADVLRTFPTNAEFLALNGHNRLRRVLRRIAVTDTELGYCQSLNFIAAIFIMVLHDEDVVQSAVQNLLLKLGTRCWYTDGMKQLRADTAVLEDLLKERLPAVHGALRAHKFDLLFVSSKWFLCLFATSLDGEALRRVWDVMLSDGIEAVFRVAFAMLAHCSDAILKAASFDDLIFMFQDWRLESSPDELISAAYDASLIGSISRADLSQRRRQAAARVSSADTRAEMRNLQFLRGGVRPASVLAR